MYRVLIADDEPIERQVISKKLNGFFKGQIEIFLAANGVEAVEIVKEKHCQIAVLDISMPGKNGLDAAEEIIPCRLYSRSTSRCIAHDWIIYHL